MSIKMPIVVIATIVKIATITVVPVTIIGTSNLVFAQQPLKFVICNEPFG
jgi:hypothetical protein